MWAYWQWLFSRQSDRASFENFLNTLEDSETTCRVVKNPTVTQQASSALIRFFRVSSFDLRYYTDAHTGKTAGWKEDEWIQSLLTRPGGQGPRAVWVLKGEKLGAIRWVYCWKHVLWVSVQKGGWLMSQPSSDYINLRMRIHPWTMDAE